jgi:TPR repeat protein
MMKNIRNWLVTIVLGALGVLMADLAQAARVALVVGNDRYANIAPLKNARADAKAMARALEDAGFEVDLVQDLGRNELNGTLRQFKAKVSGGDEVVFFYAGHGVQLGGANYLLPVDVKGDSEDHIKDDAVHLQRVLDDLAEKQARFSLAIIDACRDNPLRGRGRNFATRGLAPTGAATGQMIVFSAGTGQQALDRLGEHDPVPNGLFTRVLLQEMSRLTTPIDRVLKNVRSEVARLAKIAGHEQVPAIYDQSLGDFYFQRGGALAGSEPATRPVAPAPSPVGSAPEILAAAAGPESALWSAVSASHTIEDYKTFLSRFASGAFADEARNRIALLGAHARTEKSKADRADWEAAEAQADPPSYLKYLKAYPLGDYRDLARTRLGRHLDALRQMGGQGDGVAQFNLGVMYETGKGVAKDEREAVAWYRKAAKQGNAHAQLRLSEMFEYGRGVMKDKREAVAWNRKAAEQGLAQAQGRLGSRYMKGQGVSIDDREAVKWYRKAADQGDDQAQLFLGVMYSEGKGVPKSDVEAVAWYRLAAEQGNAFAQLMLGLAYENGESVTKSEREAMLWYRKAAEQGNSGAQLNLGNMYSNGLGIAKDIREAAVWYRKAADQGEALAQLHLGLMYEEGQDGIKDERAAAAWYRKAAEQGQVNAQALLGFMYADGRGVTKDRKTAIYWLRKAAAQGDEGANATLRKWMVAGS